MNVMKSQYPKTTIIIGDSRRMEELKDDGVNRGNGYGRIQLYPL
jgi:hypothetical protein